MELVHLYQFISAAGLIGIIILNIAIHRQRKENGSAE